MDETPAPRARSRSALTEDHETEFEAKRRRTRKGTHSCWECRRQKLKCMFSTPTATTCIRCQRRGTKCVSQEFPEEVSVPLERTRRMGDRIVRVEALIEQLIKKVDSNDAKAADCRTLISEDGINPNHGIPTPASTVDSESSRFLALYKPSEDDGTVEDETFCNRTGLNKFECAADTSVKHEKLSRFLHNCLPSKDDTDMIYKARGHASVLFHEVWTIPYITLDQNVHKWPGILLETPGPRVHPVLIARYMLHLAILLQHVPPKFHKEIKEISESPRAMMKRLADTAIGLVTTNEELLGSIEGLECVMMESLYQSNGGNLRRSWIAIRRAMTIAQLMGIPRGGTRTQFKVLDPKTKADPCLMWFRIVFHDRHLCLMLGLQQGCLDHSMTSDAIMANETPVGRLERIHCVLASRILQRNDSNFNSHTFALTQDLDMELQRVTRILPNKWWLMPDLASSINDSQALFWDMRRLFDQLFHYNLLNQLHLPYMLRASTERKNDYSRITCVNASREVLSRFVMFRSFNRNTFCCRTVDFFALMAAMTLLLALIDSHRSSPTERLLAHQYLTDRAMIEQAQENMEEVNRLNRDVLSAQSAELLRRLLAIEAEAADGHLHRAESVSVQVPETESTQSDEDNTSALRMYIPYFGIVRIAREGVISKEVPTAQSLDENNSEDQLPTIDRNSTVGSDSRNSEAAVHFGLAGPSGTLNSRIMAPVEAGHHCVDEFQTGLPQELDVNACADIQEQPRGLPTSSPDDNSVVPHFVPQLSSSITDTLLQHHDSPVLTAGIDDWAFQGVDMAFFDSLMKGSEHDENRGMEWATWQSGSGALDT